MKILVSDSLSEKGVEIFKKAKGIEVDVKTGLPPEELKAIIKDYDGLVIRSATKVTPEIIEAADNLKVVGRAGIGLDNVDIPAASKRGIVVMNTPEGNTITTAEHTISLLLAMARKIPQATASLKAKKWEKKKFQGHELFNKTLGIIGMGKIGSIVADRAKGMKMQVIAFDPFIKPEILQKQGIESVTLEELYQRAQFISIHTPKTKDTLGLINAQAITQMKPGVMIVNCSRGGIVDEKALYDGLVSGKIAGAALDVFETEPPGESPLMTLDNFICTPHLGASTEEAQENVAVDVAEQIVDFLLHGVIKNAVNVPSVSANLLERVKPYLVLAERLGTLLSQILQGGMTEIAIEYVGEVAKFDIKPMTVSVLKGLLTPILKDVVNFVNAPFLARDRGIRVIESTTETSDDFLNLITLKVKTDKMESSISGTLFGKFEPRIVRLNSFRLEAIPEGHMLLIHNEDKPGVIGNIGITLGNNGINIARMTVGQEKERGQNVIFLTTDQPVNQKALKELTTLPAVKKAWSLEL
ncbi:MAG TPA: phosphoglycerate dehydrogenase [Thermodesulfobacteriota bacterium]|nr:phosphoglycerate dehydrogenase [Thermodesulfobacteriota bacterium]